MTELQAYFEANRQLWNQRTIVHRDSTFYDVPAFKKGRSTLTEIERRELGDVRGKKILHLQCHFGLDTLSLSRLGARVTGVDLSDTAIEEARKLNAELELDARFICCNVYDLGSHLEEEFDIVYTSFGVIGWLPDLATWAQLIGSYLKPGGFFYMAEFHPVVWMLDEDFSGVKYYYHNQELIVMENHPTYTDGNPTISGKEYSWNHATSEVLNSLLGAGLQLGFFNEYSYSPWPCFQNLVQGSDGNWRVKGLEDKIPMVFSLKGTK